MAARIEGEDAQRAGQLVEPGRVGAGGDAIGVAEQHRRRLRRSAKRIVREYYPVGWLDNECGGAAGPGVRAHNTKPPRKAACPGDPVSSILCRARNGRKLGPDFMDAKPEKPIRNGDDIGRGMLTSLLGYHLRRAQIAVFQDFAASMGAAA